MGTLKWFYIPLYALKWLSSIKSSKMSSLWVPLRGNQDPAPRLHHCFHTLPSLSLQPRSIPWVATTWICPLELKEDHGDWSLLPINKERMGDTEMLPGPGAPQGPALFQDCHLFLGLILNPFCWEQLLIPPSPPKTPAIVWRHFWLSQRWGWGRAVVLLASGGWKPGLPLNILQYSAQPQSRVIQTPMSLAPPLRSSALHKIALLLTLTAAGHFCLPPEAWLGCDEFVNQWIENSGVSVLGCVFADICPTDPEEWVVSATCAGDTLRCQGVKCQAAGDTSSQEELTRLCEWAEELPGMSFQCGQVQGAAFGRK